MAPVTMRRSRLDDDDDDLGLYDPEWLARGKKVVRDGGVVRTSIMLMDGVPNPRLMLNDASMHRPHQVGVVDSAERRLADAAYEERNVQLENAWRGPATPLLPALKDGQSARDHHAAARRSAIAAGLQAIKQVGDSSNRGPALTGCCI